MSFPKKHGYSRKGDKTYKSWLTMRERCKYKKGYADRQISICNRWNDFSNFLEDMGPRPENMTLDRIDVNGNYESSNCKWSSPKQQQRNKRNTNYLIIEGKQIVAQEIAESLNIRSNAVKYFVSVARKLKEHYGTIPDIKDRCADIS